MMTIPLVLAYRRETRRNVSLRHIHTATTSLGCRFLSWRWGSYPILDAIESTLAKISQ